MKNIFGLSFIGIARQFLGTDLTYKIGVLGKLGILVVLSDIQIFSGCIAQEAQTFPLNRVYDSLYTAGSYNFIPTVELGPYQTQKNPVTLFDPYQPGKLVDVPSEFRGFTYLPLDAMYILPGDAFLGPFFRQGRNYGPFGLMFKILDSGKAELVMDTDADLDFIEEVRDTIPINKYMLLRKVLLFTNAKKYFYLPIALRIYFGANGDSFEKIELQNLLKFEFRHVLGNDTLAIDINTHHINITCRYVDPGRQNDSLITFRMNESFLFNGTWYFLQNLDFYKSTVELVKSNQNRVSGYQEGQFLDFSSIKSITEEHLLFEQKVEWNNYSYFLFHFWGEWCNPCIKEIPELKEFERQLAMKNKIQLIHCPFVYKKALLDRTILAIKEHDLSKAQSLCMPGDCEPEIQDIESCNLSQYFRVNIFPQYILVNKEGKILYRGDLSKKGENILKQRIENLGI